MQRLILQVLHHLIKGPAGNSAYILNSATIDLGTSGGGKKKSIRSKS